jgi:uncharacterized membrane protein
MYQELMDLQKFSSALDPVFLTVPGIVLLLAGLWIWLGGCLWRRVLAGVFGAFLGFAAAILTIGVGLASVVFPAVGAIIGSALPRTTIILTGSFTIAAALLIFTAPSVEIAEPPAQTTQQTHAETTDQPEQTASHAESFEMVAEYINSLGSRIYSGIKNISKVRIAAAAAAAIIFAAVGYFAKRLTTALICSVIGTALTLSGLLLLLWYKGTDLAEKVSQSNLYYLWVAAAMICFGTAIQFILQPRTKKKNAGRKDAENKNE